MGLCKCSQLCKLCTCLGYLIVVGVWETINIWRSQIKECPQQSVGSYTPQSTHAQPSIDTSKAVKDRLWIVGIRTCKYYMIISNPSLWHKTRNPIPRRSRWMVSVNVLGLSPARARCCTLVLTLQRLYGCSWKINVKANGIDSHIQRVNQCPRCHSCHWSTEEGYQRAMNRQPGWCRPLFSWRIPTHYMAETVILEEV